MKPLGPVPCVEGVLSGRRPDDTGILGRAVMESDFHY